MREYDIYIGFRDEDDPATGHGPYFTQEGFNPADAVARFITGDDYAHLVKAPEKEHGPVDEVTAYDEWALVGDEAITASAFLDGDGSWELHVYDSDGRDCLAITLPPTDYMSATDAASELGVNRQRVNQLVRSGKLAGKKVGSTWIIPAASVRARLAALEG